MLICEFCNKIFFAPVSSPMPGSHGNVDLNRSCKIWSHPSLTWFNLIQCLNANSNSLTEKSLPSDYSACFVSNRYGGGASRQLGQAPLTYCYQRKLLRDHVYSAVILSFDCFAESEAHGGRRQCYVPFQLEKKALVTTWSYQCVRLQTSGQMWTAWANGDWMGIMSKNIKSAGTLAMRRTKHQFKHKLEQNLE